MFKRTRRSLAAVALLLMAAVSAQGAAPAVLQQVPDDASVVLVVNDLKGFSTKISNAATRMNVQIPPDLLGMLSQKVGLGKGLDQNGSMAMFLTLPGDKDEQPRRWGQTPFVLLVPTTDAKAMLAEFKLGEPDQAGIAEATLPAAAEETGFVVTVGEGKFVAYAQDKAGLTRFVGHKGMLDKALTPELAKTFEANDLVVYANVPQFADKAIKQMEQAKQTIVMMATMGAPDENTANTMKMVMELYFNGIKQVLTDTTAGALTVRLNDAGATLGFAGHFKADSTLGKLVAAQKPLGAVNLDGLPAGTILGAGTVTFDPASVSDIFGKLVDMVYSSPAVAKQANVEELKKTGELQKQMIAMQTGNVKVAMYEPTDPSKGWIKAVELIDVTDPVKFEGLLQQSIKANFGGANAMAPDMKVDVKFTAKALTVKGVELNKFVVKMTFGGEDKESAKAIQQQKMIDLMYGPEGVTLYTGIVGPKQVLAVVGGDDKLATAAVDAALSKSTALSTAPDIAAAAKDTVANPSLVAFMPVERWIKLAQKQFTHTAGPAKAGGGMAIGPVAAPATLSVGFSKTSSTMEFHMPMSMMISIAETIKEMEGAGEDGGMAPMGPGQ